jgi:urease accessory protein UreH
MRRHFARSDLVIELLGGFGICRGDEPLHLPASRRARSPLAYLIPTGRPQRRLLYPDVEPGALLPAALVTTTGGLTGGDRILVELSVAAGAAARLTTPTAARLYRVLPGDADIRIDTQVAVVAGGRAEWLAQEAILYDGRPVRRCSEAEIARAICLFSNESLVFGRMAVSENAASGQIRDRWRRRRAGRLVVRLLSSRAADMRRTALRPVAVLRAVAGDAGAMPRLDTRHPT